MVSIEYRFFTDKKVAPRQGDINYENKTYLLWNEATSFLYIFKFALSSIKLSENGALVNRDQHSEKPYFGRQTIDVYWGFCQMKPKCILAVTLENNRTLYFQLVQITNKSSQKYALSEQ